MRALSHKSIAKACLWFTALSGAYLYAFPGPNLFYIGLSLAHIGLGVIAVLIAPFLIRKLQGLAGLTKAGVILLVLGALAGVVVMIVGGTRPHLLYVYLHSILSFAGVAGSEVHAAHAASKTDNTMCRPVCSCYSSGVGRSLLAGESLGCFDPNPKPGDRSRRDGQRG